VHAVEVEAVLVEETGPRGRHGRRGRQNRGRDRRRRRSERRPRRERRVRGDAEAPMRRPVGQLQAGRAATSSSTSFLATLTGRCSRLTYSLAWHSLDSQTTLSLTDTTARGPDGDRRGRGHRRSEQP
jgi:hypothetical protein